MMVISLWHIYKTFSFHIIVWLSPQAMNYNEYYKEMYKLESMVLLYMNLAL